MDLRLAVGVAAVLAAACTHTTGRPIDMSRVAELQQGVSTLADAKERFGEPTSVTNSSMVPGTCYVWMYVLTNQFAGRSESRVVSLCFGDDGKLAAAPISQQVKVPAAAGQ